jgi:hypothetical protein
LRALVVRFGDQAANHVIGKDVESRPSLTPHSTAR